MKLRFAESVVRGEKLIRWPRFFLPSKEPRIKLLSKLAMSITDLPKFLLNKLGGDAMLPAFRNPPPSNKLITLGDLDEKCDRIAGSFRKFGVGTGLVNGKPPRVGVWGGEWAPCEFAVVVLGVIKAGAFLGRSSGSYSASFRT